MRSLNLFKPASLFCLALLCICGPKAFGQSTLINAPSTEVVSPKQVYFEMDFITNYAWERDNSYQTYIPRAVVGVGKNVEVGVNVSFTRQSGVDHPIEFQPNAKWQFFNNEEKGLAGAVGCIWYMPATHRTGTDTFGQCYTTFSKQFSGSYAPRFTGGAYVLIGSGPDQSSKAGAIVAYEQPFSKNTGLIIDWFSGRNRFGYVSPGLYVTMPGNGSLSGGYAISNYGRGNNYLFAYYGMTF